MLPDPGQFLEEALPKELWNHKEALGGLHCCSELDEDLKNGWGQAKQCLTVL